MSDGFLGRWSRRKLDAREGKPLPEDPRIAPPEVQQCTPEVAARPEPPADMLRAGPPTESTTPLLAAEPAVVPPPTLEDVQALTAESDFSRFAARDVAPEVKNAALKKLFGDPRYNVMDGMDVYVGDYSKADPIPRHLLRQLATAATLKLFDDEPARAATPEQPAQPVRPRDVADNPTGETVAQSSSERAAGPEPTDHADPDLRLQQDDAAPGAESGNGAA